MPLTDFDKILNSTKFADLRITFGKYNEKSIENIKKKFDDNQIVITNLLQKPKIENLKFDTVLKIDNKELKLSSIIDKKSCEDFLLSYININMISVDSKNISLLNDNVLKEREIHEYNSILRLKENIKPLERGEFWICSGENAKIYPVAMNAPVNLYENCYCFKCKILKMNEIILNIICLKIIIFCTFNLLF